MKKRYSEEQIVGFLREADGGVAVKDLCRRHGFSEASYYLWRSKYGGTTNGPQLTPKRVSEILTVSGTVLSTDLSESAVNACK